MRLKDIFQILPFTFLLLHFLLLFSFGAAAHFRY